MQNSIKGIANQVNKNGKKKFGSNTHKENFFTDFSSSKFKLE